MVRFRVPAGARDVSLLHGVQTSSGSNPTSYKMGTEKGIPGVKRLGREADHSPPSRTEAKNNGAVPPLPCTSQRRGV
jgi:hypothetical protein